MRAWVLALAACGGSAAAPDAAPPPDAGVDAPTRPYALASSGAQLVLEPQPAIRLLPLELAGDVDAVLVHQEFYGLPWEAFASGTAPPAAWVAAMDELVAQSTAPVFLQLQLISGPGRHYLADRAVVSGDVLGNPQVGWSTECYDFATAPDRDSLRAAYLAYVDWMVRRFHPRWVNVAIEMNFFMSCGDGPWQALVDLERAAYVTAKAAEPAALVFPSIQLEVLYGWGGDCPSEDHDACFAANHARLAGVLRDRFAVTSLPFLVEALRDQAAIPDDWLTRAGDLGGEATVVAETGWLAEPMVVRLGAQCVDAIAASEDAQLAWFERVLAVARDRRLELVTWVANRDLIPTEMMADCPCDFDTAWCALLDALRQSAGSDPNAQASAEYSLKRFGAMGLRRHDGTPRARFFSRWQEARALAWP